jgi:hypothetical protein
MNDDFLSKFRQPPRPAFARALYLRLEQTAEAKPVSSQYPTAARIVRVLAVLFLAFLLTLDAFPTVRAAALAVVEGIIKTFTAQGTVVIIDDNQPAESGEGETYAEIWQPGSLDKISADYPFFDRLPAWSPPGFLLQERAAFIYASMHQNLPSAVLFEWKKDNVGIIQLRIEKGSCPGGPIYNPASPSLELGSDCTRATTFIVSPENQPETLTVNRQPAVLFHHLQMLMNLSDPVRQWNPARGTFDNRDSEALYLTWENNGTLFSLASKAQTVTKEELLRMAESIP